MFLKVTYQDVKIVVNFNLTSGMVISELIAVVQKQLNAHLGTTTTHVPEIWTGDGFYMNPSYRVAEVLREGDMILVPSYDTWLKNVLKFCDETWLTVTREDLRDRKQKVAIVGRSKQNKIFVKTCLNAYLEGPLIIIEASKFNGQTKCTDTVIQTAEDTKDGKWFIEARYWVSETHIIQGISLHVKSASDKSEWVDAIPISLGKNDVLVKGEVVHLKGSDNAEEEEDEVEYTLPSTEVTGDDIFQEEVVLTRHTPEGESPIKMSWKKDGACYVNQSFGSGDKFTTYLSIAGVNLLNDSDKPTAIVEVDAVYKNAAEEWIEVGGTQIGTQRQSTWPEFDWKKETTFTMDPMKTDLVAFSVAIPCVGKSGNDNFQRSRLPTMLPKILEVKITLKDSQGRTASLVFEHTNKPVVLDTKESYCKKNGIRLENCDFVYCDDTEFTTRNYAAVSIKKNVVKVQYSIGYYWEYKQVDLASLAFKAKDKPAQEYLIDAMTQKGYMCYACVDLNREKLYAFKLCMNTSTGSKIQYVKVPKFLVPTKGLKVNELSVPTKIKLGDDIPVSFRVAPPAGSDWIGIFPVDSEGATGYSTYVYPGDNTIGVIFIDHNSNHRVGSSYVCRYITKDNDVVCQSPEFVFYE